MRTSSAKAKEFFLTLSKSNQVSIVDEDDYYRFRGFNWYLNDNGYVVTDSTKRSRSVGVSAKIRLHRLILGVEDGPDVDHIDGNKLNNRKSNLRKCSRSENLQNRIKSKDVRGVYFRQLKKSSVWFSVISIPKSKPKKQKYLGQFKTRKEAAEAFMKASIEMHGVFSPYNGVKIDES